MSDPMRGIVDYRSQGYSAKDVGAKATPVGHSSIMPRLEVTNSAIALKNNNRRIEIPGGLATP